MSDCLFCSIVAGDTPAERVATGDGVIAIRDIAPRAPVHVLADGMVVLDEPDHHAHRPHDPLGGG